jgi:hypothetical protein
LPPPSAATNEAHDEQEQYGTDGGIEDCTNQSRSEMDTELGQQPASDKGAQNSDANVADVTCNLLDGRLSGTDQSTAA